MSLNKVRNKIQEKAVKAILKCDWNGYIDVAPRVGKSKIICDAINSYKKSSILIIAPYNPILESWKEELSKWEVKQDVKIINQRSLEKVNLLDYDIVISDEIHTLSEKQLGILKFAKKVFGLSGSISKDTKKILKDELGLKMIFEYSIEDAIRDDIVSDYRINLVPLYLDNKDKYIKAGTKDKPFMTTEQKNYEYLCRMFDKFKKLSWGNAKFAPLKMQWAGKRARLIYGAKSKIELAQKIIKKYGDDRMLIFTAKTDVADQFAPSYHSKSKENNLEKFFNMEIDKLAVCEMTSMGITFPELKMGLFHQIKSSEESAIQKIMRMCNLEDTKTAEIFITFYKGTMDEKWVEKSLSGFSDTKIQTLSHI